MLDASCWMLDDGCSRLKEAACLPARAADHCVALYGKLPRPVHVRALQILAIRVVGVARERQLRAISLGSGVFR